jgi:hypothetical protein
MPIASPSVSPAPDASGGNARMALQHLLDVGVLTPAEYEELRARVRA